MQSAIRNSKSSGGMSSIHGNMLLYLPAAHLSTQPHLELDRRPLVVNLPMPSPVEFVLFKAILHVHGLHQSWHPC